MSSLRARVRTCVRLTIRWDRGSRGSDYIGKSLRTDALSSTLVDSAIGDHCQQTCSVVYLCFSQFFHQTALFELHFLLNSYNYSFNFDLLLATMYIYFLFSFILSRYSFYSLFTNYIAD